VPCLARLAETRVEAGLIYLIYLLTNSFYQI